MSGIGILIFYLGTQVFTTRLAYVISNQQMQQYTYGDLLWDHWEASCAKILHCLSSRNSCKKPQMALHGRLLCILTIEWVLYMLFASKNQHLQIPFQLLTHAPTQLTCNEHKLKKDH